MAESIDDIEIDWAELQMTLDDEIEWMKGEHQAHPARYANCPDCNRFSRYPWEKEYGTQDGTIYEWGGVCAEHGPWRDGS